MNLIQELLLAAGLRAALCDGGRTSFGAQSWWPGFVWRSKMVAGLVWRSKMVAGLRLALKDGGWA